MSGESMLTNIRHLAVIAAIVGGAAMVLEPQWAAEATAGLGHAARQAASHTINDLMSALGEHGTTSPRAAPAQDQPARAAGDVRMPAALAPLTPSPAGVQISASIAVVDRYTLDATIEYTVPPDKRLCVGYVAMEAVAVKRTADEYKCLDKPVVGRVSDTVSLRRLDLSGLPSSHDAAEHQAMRDGFMLLVMTVDGQVSVQRLDSPYFKRLSRAQRPQ